LAASTQCIDSTHIPKKILHNTIGGKRPVGKPKRRWTEAIGEESEKILGIEKWKKKRSCV
jgi:hypothetical protein